MSLIKCENITLSYENLEVIGSLSFEINEGDYLCILGENGSGKSTLIRALLGLKKPAGGSINFGSGFNRNEIGYIPQQTPVQKDFPATVSEIIRTGCLNRKKIGMFYTGDDKRKVDEVMEKLHITDLKNKSYRELSGGQQQRTLIGRALCAAGKMLLLDEPVTGLDHTMTNELYEIINELNKESKITVIMVSHDPAAIKYASHILHIQKDGFYFGKKEDYRPIWT